MIFLDTGFFVALFSVDDSLHDRAEAWALRSDEPLLVTEYVLWECVNTFSKPKDRATAHALIEHVESDPACEVVRASADLFAAGLRLHRNRPDKEWSLTDCVSFHLMRERGLTRALAYDIHFEQAGFEAMLRRDPPT
jgi:predicted nucleic acid-binding protein